MPKFGKEPNGNYFNEYYGEVTLLVAEAINEFKWSPSDYDFAVRRYGSMMGLHEALKTNNYQPDSFDYTPW